MSHSRKLARCLSSLTVFASILGGLSSPAPAQPGGLLQRQAREKPRLRVPAEWETHDSTWMQWPRWYERSYRPAFTEIIRVLVAHEPVHLIVHTPAYENEARNYLSQRGVPLDNVSFDILPLDNAWMRDNGPVWIESAGQLMVQDWGFDGWGGWTPFFQLDDAIPPRVAEIAGVPVQDWNRLVHERGNLEFNGVDTVIVNWACIGNRNPGFSQNQITRALKRAFGVSRVVMLQSATSDDGTDGHVDGIARFIDQRRVVVPRYRDQSHADAWVYEDAAAIVEGSGLQVLRMDIPGDILYRGFPMSAIYVNWLVANDVVVMPGFAHPTWDAAAKLAVESYFPDRQVHVVDTRELWYSGGSVHCVTNDQPEPR